MVTWVPLKNICETTVCNFGFKENCKTIICDYGFKKIYKTTVCDCGFYDIFKTTVTNYDFMVIMIKNILKIILKSQYHKNGSRLKIILKYSY